MKHPVFFFSLCALALAGCSDGHDGGKSLSKPALCAGAEINPERLFLQQLGPDRVIIKWRGNADGGAEADRVCFGTDMNALPQSSQTLATVTATGHSEVLLTGLSPETTYYYSVGGAAGAMESRHFRTAPESGELPADGNTRIWFVGDSGSAGFDDPGAAQVRDGFQSWLESNGGEPTDLFLMLGDNAYNQGTDLEHQKAIFETYPEILASTPLWPTIGNHEMGSFGISSSPDPGSYQIIGSGDHGGPDPAPDSPMPYLNIFTLPTAGEVGGVASGTEQYYAFDYANIHIVSLDTQLTMRDEVNRETMKQWLKDDLMSNNQDWTIVIFHHPPYSQGDQFHDTDNTYGGRDQPSTDIREQFTPIFEDYGVDLVYSGHAHVFERSYYLNGHTGFSDTFDPSVHAELNDMGAAASGQGDEAYTQLTRNGTDDKVVYTVAGNAGYLRAEVPNAFHPAHYSVEMTLGSVVLDVGESRLEARAIDASGAVIDSFVMTR